MNESYICATSTSAGVIPALPNARGPVSAAAVTVRSGIWEMFVWWVVPCAAPEDVDRLDRHVRRALGSGHDACPAAVGDDTAVELVEWVRHEPRRDDIFDGDRVAVLGHRVVRGVRRAS